jgi:hypothetical protein
MFSRKAAKAQRKTGEAKGCQALSVLSAASVPSDLTDDAVTSVIQSAALFAVPQCLYVSPVTSLKPVVFSARLLENCRPIHAFCAIVGRHSLRTPGAFTLSLGLSLAEQLPRPMNADSRWRLSSMGNHLLCA